LINLVHDPKFADISYEINLTGHVHNNWKIERIRREFGFTDCINVGVDVWGFKPIAWEEIIKRMKSHKPQSIKITLHGGVKILD